jgi:hypothetical protein
MGDEATTTSTGQDQGKNSERVSMSPSALETSLKAIKIYRQEIATYVRELPRLLEEGHAWRHALIKGDEVLSIWDTQGDAMQAGRERFGLDPICVKTIDPRDIERFAFLKKQLGDACPY